MRITPQHKISVEGARQSEALREQGRRVALDGSETRCREGTSIALPYLAVALCVPLARALGVYGRVSVPALVLLSILAGPALVALVPRLASPLPESLDDWLEPGHRWLASLWAAGGLFALGALGRNAVFLGDPSRTDHSVLPADAFLVRHSCLTAYMHGALLSRSATAKVTP